MAFRKLLSAFLVLLCQLSLQAGRISAQTRGTGSVTVNGTEEHLITQKCTHWVEGGDCIHWVTTTIYDSGSVSVTVNGHADSVSYGQGSTSGSIASALATAVNGDSSSFVTASVAGSVITLSAKATGCSTNYSVSTSVTYDSTDFSVPSFAGSPSGTSLDGGSDGSPSITGFSPPSGAAGTSVSITGSNFCAAQGSSTVSFGGAQAMITSWGATSITATVPTTAGTGSVGVVVGGIQVLSTQAFIVAPVITNVSTTAAYPGTSVTITGANFAVASGPCNAESRLAIGGACAPISSNTSTSITAAVPPGAMGTGIEVCTVGNGIAACYTWQNFTVLHASLLLGGTPGAGGSFEEHDDTGALLQAGTLSIPRSLHSATVLQNGTVFVAGGVSDATSWQILDHNANVLSSGLLHSSRFLHSSTLLQNGNVFLAGGAGSPGDWEIHSPTGVLVASGSLAENRGSGASAVTLQNGDIWLSGGSLGSGDECDYEILDANGNHISSGSLSGCFAGGAVQALSNGNVILLGGDNASGTYEIRTQAGAFVATSSMENGFNHGSNSVILQNGNVFIFGSCQIDFAYPDMRDPNNTSSDPTMLSPACTTSGAISSWEIRDVNGNFVATGSLQDSRDGAGAVVLSNGNVFITGGNLCGGCWEIRSSVGALVSQGTLLNSDGGGHTLTHF